jgi:flagellin
MGRESPNGAYLQVAAVETATEMRPPTAQGGIIMSLTIQTNVLSLNAQRNLNVSQAALSKSMQRLSSGLRINSAADDAAGLAISQNMNAQVTSMNQASRNANDGVSMVQTAEGSLNETSNILVRMRELATQSATGTVGSTERGYINKEFQALSSEIDRISNATEFNGTKLLNGSLSTNGVTLQVGARNTTNADQINVKIGNASATGLSIASVDLSSASGARSALDTLDTAIQSVSSLRANLGTAQNRLTSTINNLQVAVENTSASMSRIKDVDVASESANMTRANILVQAGTSILAQANQSPQAALSLLR